jgi:hypothetical protein
VNTHLRSVGKVGLYESTPEMKELTGAIYTVRGADGYLFGVWLDQQSEEEAWTVTMRTLVDGDDPKGRVVSRKRVVAVHAVKAVLDTLGEGEEIAESDPRFNESMLSLATEAIRAMAEKVGVRLDAPNATVLTVDERPKLEFRVRAARRRASQRTLRPGASSRPTANTDQHSSLRSRWSSSTRSRISSGSWSRCHLHSRRPPGSPSSSAAARAALIA